MTPRRELYQHFSPMSQLYELENWTACFCLTRGRTQSISVTLIPKTRKGTHLYTIVSLSLLSLSCSFILWTNFIRPPPLPLIIFNEAWKPVSERYMEIGHRLNGNSIGRFPVSWGVWCWEKRRGGELWKYLSRLLCDSNHGEMIEEMVTKTEDWWLKAIKWMD